MPKHKPSTLQRQLDFDYVERNRWVKLRLLEELPTCEKVKHVLSALDRCIRDKKWCSIGNRKLALRMGVSERTASNRINQAADAGWIEIKRTPGWLNSYRIIWQKVFDESCVDIQNELLAAQSNIDKGRDAEVELEKRQAEQRAANLERKPVKPTAQPAKKSKTFDLPTGYCPSGLPPESKKSGKPKTLTLARKTGRRWDLHVETDMLSDPVSMDQLFERAVKLGFAKNTTNARMIVWSIAVHCRSAESPGGLFRYKIENCDLKVSMAEEDKALKEMKDYDDQSDAFNSMLDEAFQGAT